METSGRRSAEKPFDNHLNMHFRGNRPQLQTGTWFSLLFAILSLLVWEIAARNGILSELFFPAPSTIAGALVNIIANGKLAIHVSATLSRVFWGFLMGGLSGLLIGLAMGWSGRIREVLDPLVAASHPVPKIALLPLLMILFGVGETSKIIVIAIAAFFPLLINSMTGVQQIHPVHFQVARNYNAGKFKMFTRVVLPGSLPFVISGMRISLNFALLITIAVELVAARKGLGAMIWLAWETLRVEELYVSIAVTALLGIGFNTGLQYLMKRLVPWGTQSGI